MNKVTKGALATAAGVALLLGGGGTLAVWNESQNTSAGIIAAGDLGLSAGAGSWTSNVSGTVVDIATYKIVPGETLTYSQNVTLTLVGNQMKANMAVTGVAASTFTASNITVGDVVLKNASGVVLPGNLTAANNNDVVTASTSFAFNSTATGVESTGATYDFASVAYKLEQVAPTLAPVA